MAISTVSVTSGRKEAELLDLPPSYYQLFEPLPPPYSSVQDLTYDPDSPSSSKLQLPSAPPYTAIDENSDHHGDYGDQPGTPIRQPLTSSTSQNGNRRSRSDSTAILIPGSGPGSDEFEPDLNPSDVLSRVRSENRDTRGNNSRRSGSGSRSQSRSSRNGNGTGSGSGSGSDSGSRNSGGNGSTDAAGATAAGLKASCCKHFCTIMAGLAVFAFIVCVIQWLYVKSEKKRSGYDFDTSNFNYPEFNFNPSSAPNQEIQIPFSKINYDDFFANWKASQNVNKEKELYFNQFND